MAKIYRFDMDNGVYCFDATDSIWAVDFGLAACVYYAYNCIKMSKFTTTPTPSSAMLDVWFNGIKPIGKMIMEVDGYWYYEFGGAGGLTSIDFHEGIAALLKELNAPYEAQLKAYFDNQPKETDQSVEDDSLPF